MIVNIAFNTIIYIMVFLFPGVIFRRTFFSGKFRNNFEAGNNFERILWCILLSVFTIACFCLMVVFLDQATNSSISHLFSISESDILKVFEEIYSNKYPHAFKTPKSLLNIFFIFFSLYIFSGILGIITNKLIFVLKLEKSVSLLKFENQWDYLAVSNKITNPNHRFGDICTTQIDVKTENDELFTGYFHQFLLDKDGKVESIVIKDTYKFYILDKVNDCNKITEIREKIENEEIGFLPHLESLDKYHYKKRIKGHIFIVPNEEIKNISVTYIRLSNVFDRYQNIGRTLISILLGLTLLFSVAYGIWDFEIFKFASYWRRIAFCIVFFFNVLFLILFCTSFFKSKPIDETNILKYKNNIKDSLIILSYSLVPYVYILGYVKFYILIPIMIVFIIIMSFIFSKSSNDNI